MAEAGGPGEAKRRAYRAQTERFRAYLRGRMAASGVSGRQLSVAMGHDLNYVGQLLDPPPGRSRAVPSPDELRWPPRCWGWGWWSCWRRPGASRGSELEGEIATMAAHTGTLAGDWAELSAEEREEVRSFMSYVKAKREMRRHREAREEEAGRRWRGGRGGGALTMAERPPGYAAPAASGPARPRPAGPGRRGAGRRLDRPGRPALGPRPRRPRGRHPHQPLGQPAGPGVYARDADGAAEIALRGDLADPGEHALRAGRARARAGAPPPARRDLPLAIPLPAAGPGQPRGSRPRRSGGARSGCCRPR